MSRAPGPMDRVTVRLQKACGVRTPDISLCTQNIWSLRLGVMVQRGGDEGIYHLEAGVLRQKLGSVTQYWARPLCDQAGWDCNEGQGINSASVQTVVRRTHISSHRVCEKSRHSKPDLYLSCAQAETDGSRGAMMSSGAQGHLLGSLVVSRIIPCRSRRKSSFLFTYFYIFY